MSLNEISKNINSTQTSQDEKNSFSEVGTPHSLRSEMINIIPIQFWKNPKHKVLEPSCGKGGFLINVIQKFMKYLPIPLKNRYQFIVENILVFGDINKNNVKICRKILGDYKLQYFVGDSLKLDLSNFDLVIGNPPYNKLGQTDTGNTIYQLFIIKALTEWLNPKGYLLFVTPSAWRKPVSEYSKNKGMYDLMTNQNWMKYLEIHDKNDGKKVFNAGTRYDWYLIQKTKPKITIIKDEKNIIHKVNLKNWPWLPNYDYEIIKNLLAKKGEPTVDVISNSEFNSNKDFMSNKESKKYKYVCIHSTPKKGIKFLYSSIKPKKNPKVIFGNSGTNSAIINKTGKYCMTEHAIGIIDKKENLEKILETLKSDKMKNILKACLWSNFQIEWKLFKDFKKDFYKII